jgi:hypothetical protein
MGKQFILLGRNTMKYLIIMVPLVAMFAGAEMYQLCSETPVVVWTVNNDSEQQLVGQVYALPGTYGLIENIWVRTKPQNTYTQFASMDLEIRIYKFFGSPATLMYYHTFQVPWSTEPTWHSFPVHYQWNTSWSTQIMVCAESIVKTSTEPVGWNRESFAGDNSLTSPNPNWWLNEYSTSLQWQLAPSFGDWNFRLEYNQNVPVEPQSLGRIKSVYH